MAHPDRVGAAMGVARLRVVGPDGRSLPTGETGEIAFHGPSVMDGYHGRAAETAAALHDGWVRTGDLGRLDEDGQLHYAGRTKEMIKTGGFSVDPREVEDALVAVPGIREAAVIGVPDEHWGEMVVAFVAPRGAVAPDELRAACREHLAGYKLPKQILEVDRLPLNATGKVQRGVLRERYAAGGPPAA
jgi:acyl-CoA synthetase (AMP-forming)/AMP-acid ligase II